MCETIYLSIYLTLNTCTNNLVVRTERVAGGAPRARPFLAPFLVVFPTREVLPCGGRGSLSTCSFDHLAAVGRYLYAHLLRLAQVLEVVDLPLAVEGLGTHRVAAWVHSGLQPGCIGSSMWSILRLPSTGE